MSSTYLGISQCRCFSLYPTLHSMSTFSLTFNEDTSSSVVIYTLPSIYSLHSLLDRSPKWPIPELFFSLLHIFKISFIPSMPYVVTAHYVLSLWFSNFHVHINHLGILVKTNILIQCCGPAPEIPHYYQVPRKCQCCLSAVHTSCRRVLGNIPGITDTKTYAESTQAP